MSDDVPVRPCPCAPFAPAPQPPAAQRRHAVPTPPRRGRPTRRSWPSAGTGPRSRRRTPRSTAAAAGCSSARRSARRSAARAAARTRIG